VAEIIKKGCNHIELLTSVSQIICCNLLLVWKTAPIPKPAKLSKHNKMQRKDIETLLYEVKFKTTYLDFWTII